MAINYNVNPYYDNYDETKQFYRILFRPGRAVQARELTQIQTSLQKQIERFGQGVYKDGSIVVPGSFTLDQRYNHVKLTSSLGSNVSDTLISSLVGNVITGANSGIQALVVNSTISTSDGDPPTLFVKYLNANTSANASISSITRFSANELITNVSGNITLQTANTSPTGNGTAFSTTGGVIFTKGVFAYFDAQTLIVDKYATTNNAIIGFTVTESTVEATSDTTLLDPAVGASNYIAPGADRYKISLDLAKRDLTFNSNDDPNFIEIARIEDGEFIALNVDPKYSVLGDTLARRTFDESGNYIVKPYDVRITNHLRTSNTSNDGIYLATSGGDDNKLVSIVQPGKAYVKGYEVDSIRTKYIVGNKARDFANVNNGVVATTIGNYIFVTNVFSIPDLSLLPTVSFYNRYNVTPGTANGDAIGTGKIRGFELYTGTPGTATAIYKLWLFDVTMSAGYIFENDVKQLYVDNSGYSDFTADISPNLTILTGSVTTANIGSNTVTGIATRFNDELKVNDFITINSVKYRVTAIANSSSITVTPNVVSNLSGTLASVDSVVYNDNKNLLHLFEFPYSTIKTVDPTNLETSYDVKRLYSRTLSSNSVTISAGTDETFDSVSTTDYVLVVKSGANSGQYLNPSTFVSRSGGGSSVTINLSSLANNPTNVANYSTADVSLVAKLTKTNTSADKKTKTLVSNATIDYINANTAQATTISLAKADAFKLVSVKMSNVAFGSAYSTSGEIDITSRYTFDNGQKPTYYDVGTISLKPSQSKPTGPIRITFDYFTHGTGDYFSVDSYSGIDYKNIPSFTHSGKTYQLRDCLDFRPRINDAGTGFTGTGAVVNDFLDPSSDVLTDYSYYLPKIDKIVINKDGVLSIANGTSSLTPIEPNTPQDTMALFILKQKAYVFDVNEDIEVIEIDNRRYTMRDIGRIENRVKNLEYYTSLNLLEQDTQALQIKDSLGFDKFKNGFIVDNFSGHGIGDVFNRDYGVAIDYNKKELRPLCKTLQISLNEVCNTSMQRAANNYVKTGDLITLPYSNTSAIVSNKASTTENINPFSVVLWTGTVSLEPPQDLWYDQTRLPTIQRNENGNYDQFLAEAKAKGTFGTIWGNWSTNYYGNVRTEERVGVEYTVSEKIDTRTDNDVVVNTSIIPKMRSFKVKFTGEGLKANTRLKVFFDNINVTNYCLQANTNLSGNLNNGITEAFSSNVQSIITDSTGKVEGEFQYISEIFNLDIGEKRFILTDSPTNSSDFETFAQTTFTSKGEQRSVRDEIVSTRNAVLNTRDVLDRQTFVQNGGGGGGGDPVIPPSQRDYIDLAYAGLMGRPPDASGKAYWYESLSAQAAAKGYGSLDNLISLAKNDGSLIQNGGINLQPPGGGNPIDGFIRSDIGSLLGVPATNIQATADLYELTYQIASAALTNPSENPSSQSLLTTVQVNGISDTHQAAQYAAAQLVYSFGAVNNNSFTGLSGPAVTIAQEAVTQLAGDGSITSNFGNTDGDANVSCPYDPLAQSIFVISPLFVTKLDLYFSAKDTVTPMRVQIRKMVNGFPGPYIIPFSEKVVYPNEITTSDDSSVATTIVFDSPIFLDTGEYAIVLLSESINYRVWISQIGQTDVLTKQLISEQPYIGVLFKSQNASTWTPDQFQDLKFTLYKAVFDTSVTGIVEFNVDDKTYDQATHEVNGIDPLEVSPNSNILRVYHKEHGQSVGSSVKLLGFPLNGRSFGSTANSSFFGINVQSLITSTFPIANTTINSYTITLPQAVNANVTSITRTGGSGIIASQDFKYDTYYPAISTLTTVGTSTTHKIKTTADATYVFDTSFKTISLGGDYNFDSPRTLASNVNRQISMSNTNPFLHRVELTSLNNSLSPVIDTKKVSGVFVRNLINNPSYDSENSISANDIITIANASNIVVTQVSGAEGRITLTSTQDKINAVGIIKGTYLNISANNGVNNGQYRVLNVTDNGANISIYNVSTQNVSTNATATYTITNGRNFIAEEAAYDGSAYSKYITREVSFVNPCTSFKIYLDVAKPTDASLKFYYKISEVGDTIDLKDKEYTEITGITVPTSLDGTFNEIEKIVENLPQFDAIIFKLVFLGTNSSQVAKCKNLRVIALA